MEQLSEIKNVIRTQWEQFVGFYGQQMQAQAPELNIVMEYVLAHSGKMLRPLLTLLAAEIGGGICQRSYLAAAMVEMVHAGTLLHDDVIDDAQQRHGMATVNSHWKSKIAVLVGDFTFAKAFLAALEGDAADMALILCRATLCVGEGEVMQMQHTQTLDTSEELYFEIIRRKTAALMQACAHIGAVSAGAGDAQVEALKEFGLNAGIAFQIRDDILDFYDASETGKHAGNDIVERKLTLPLIAALRNTSKSNSSRILAMVANAKRKRSYIGRVKDFVAAHGGFDYAQEKTMDYAALAKEALSIYPDGSIKTALLRLTDYIVERQK